MQTKELFAVTSMKSKEEEKWTGFGKMVKRHEEELQSLLQERVDFQQINTLLAKHQQETDKLMIELIESTNPKKERHEY